MCPKQPLFPSPTVSWLEQVLLQLEQAWGSIAISLWSWWCYHMQERWVYMYWYAWSSGWVQSLYRPTTAGWPVLSTLPAASSALVSWVGWTFLCSSPIHNVKLVLNGLLHIIHVVYLPANDLAVVRNPQCLPISLTTAPIHPNPSFVEPSSYVGVHYYIYSNVE